MTPRYFSKDILDFLSRLSEHEVYYLIVGGEAVIYYGYPRFTGDLDIYFECTPENSSRLWKALTAFWGDDVPGLRDPSELLEPGAVIQFGVPPNRLDLINIIDGVSFQSAWENRVTENVTASGGEIKIFFISLDDLIRNKKAVSRNKDLDDLKYLERKNKESNHSS
jgi:hypothetical protein